jgi:hypothetical protein
LELALETSLGATLATILLVLVVVSLAFFSFKAVIAALLAFWREAIVPRPNSSCTALVRVIGLVLSVSFLGISSSQVLAIG